MGKKAFVTFALLCLPLWGLGGLGAWAEAQYIEGDSGPMWEYDEGSKTLTISGTGDMPTIWPTKLPWANIANEIDKVVVADGVTSIAEGAFHWLENMTEATIGSGVKSIGRDAFTSCHKLTGIHIPANVTSVDNEAFLFTEALSSITVAADNPVYDSRNGCNAIIETATNKLIKGCKNTTIPDGIVILGDRAFAWVSDLGKVEVPNSVTTIECSVFYTCKGLTEVTIGDGVTELPGFTFGYCEDLLTVTLGKGLKKLDDAVFHDCFGLKTVNFASDGQLTSIGRYTFYRTAIEKLEIPNSVTSLGQGVFSWMQSLKELILGDGITTTPFEMLYQSPNVESITFPASITNLSGMYKTSLEKLDNIYCWAYPDNVSWEDNANYFKSNKGTRFHVIDQAAWEMKFPEANVTFVQDLVPAGTLTYSVDTGQGVAHVTGITGTNPTGVVMIPATYSYEGTDYPVTTIASGAFKDKTGLTSVSFPNVSVIAANAFEGCTGLTTLNLPASLTSVGTEAFKGCTGLRSVVIDANFGGSLFAGCDNISAITFGDNITRIGAAAFQNLPNLTSVTIPANITTIGGEAFDGCGNLSTITFLGTTPPATNGAQLYGIASKFAMRVPTGSVDAYRAHDIWGHYPTHIECMPWAGSGTESDPYLISHKDELDLLAKRVNEGNTYFETYFKVTADITYNPSARYFDNGKSNYIPIGNSSMYYSDFWGIFDGGGHTISGIRIDRSSGGDQHELALFGRSMKYEAVIKNLILDDTQISGKNYIAGILACGSCTVTNCHVTKRVIIDASLNDAFFHGGIAGMTYGMSVNHCTSAATLTIADGITKHNYFGAIAGNSWGEKLNDNLAIGATIPATSIGDHGAIAGCSPWYLERNYYTACTVAGVENAVGVGGAYNETFGDQTANDGAVPALRDNADNSTALGLFAALPATLDLGFGAGKFPMQLAGRTLYRDGSWNTLCLPFSTVIEGSPLEGATVMTLSSASFSTGTLTLNFDEVSASGEQERLIEAGRPYIVKWSTLGDPIENPAFTAVTISSTAPTPVDCGPVTFRGNYSPVTLEANDRSILYLGDANTLYYPKEAMTIGAFRAYFQLTGLTAGEKADGIRSFVLNFGDESSTQGVTTPLSNRRGGGGEASWYTLDGRRLSGKPATKGLYINNGKKVIIR